MLGDAWRPFTEASSPRTPSLSWTPHVHPRLYILSLHPQCTVSAPQGHSTSQQSRSQLTCWPVIESDIVHPGAAKGKCWKSDFFFPAFPSPRSGKSECPQSTVVTAALGKERCFSPIFCHPHASLHRVLKRASKANKLGVGDFPSHYLAVW